MSDIDYTEWQPVSNGLPRSGLNVLVWGKCYPCPDGPDIRCTHRYGDKVDWPEGWRPGERYEITHWKLVTPPK